MPDPQLDAFFDATLDYGLVLLDPEGAVVRWNAGAEQITGYPPRIMVGSSIGVLYPDDERDAGRSESDLAVAVADGRHEHLGWRRRADGSPFWASTMTTPIRGDDGRLAGFGVIMRDLTDQKRGEDALRESEERFRLLVSAVADYAIFLLNPDGTVASWNLGAERLKGYTAGEIIGRHLSTFYTDEDRRRQLPQHALREAAENGRWEQEGWRLRKDGSRFWANVVITSLTGPDGEHWGFTKVTRDLTDRKRSEDALRGVLERERDAASRLRELDRMRGDLIAIITHDLRAPVGVLRNLLDLYRTEREDLTTDEAGALVERMSGKAELLASLVDDVFEMTLLEAGRLQFEVGPVDVDQLLEQLAQDVLTSAGRSVQIREGGGRWVRADSHRRWQVLSNLLSNAVKFSAADAPIRIATSEEDEVVRVRVSDDGPGIPEEHLEEVFDPFRRLASSTPAPGSGLGLHIAKMMVEGQGGRIWAESGPDEGATFVVELPRAEPAPA